MGSIANILGYNPSCIKSGFKGDNQSKLNAIYQ